MSGVLLDTNVVSELVRARPDPNAISFVRGLADPYLSVLTVHELTHGAERTPQGARRIQFIAWIAALKARFAGRIVAITEEIAEHAGRLRAAAEAQGCPAEAIDCLIAACALARGAAVATRNGSDFAPLGVPVINPWNA